MRSQLKVIFLMFFILTLMALGTLSFRYLLERPETPQPIFIEKEVDHGPITIEWQIPDLTSFPQFTAETTAYTAGPESTGKAPGDPAYGITKSGEKVQAFRTVAAGPDIPIGTLIYIQGFNGVIFEVQDRGSAIDNTCIDIYFEDLAEAQAYGRKEATVWILKWGNQ